jgi:hypothetical protein
MVDDAWQIDRQLVEDDRKPRDDLQQRMLVHDGVRVPVARGVGGPLHRDVRPCFVRPQQP